MSGTSSLAFCWPKLMIVGDNGCFRNDLEHRLRVNNVQLKKVSGITMSALVITSILYEPFPGWSITSVGAQP